MSYEPMKLNDKYTSMDALNAIINKLKAQGWPEARDIPVVVDEDE